MIKNKKQMLLVITIFTLLLIVGSVTYAFFNYTRTGAANTLKVGRIAFNSTQNNTINLENVFPTSSSNLNSSNSDTVTINITGDTTYSEGIEYKVTLDQVNNTINGKEVPISFNVTASYLGTKDSSYYTNRGGATPIYNLTETGQVEDGKYILVGYIPQGSTGVNGSIDITAFIDGDRVAISDTVSTIDNGNLIYGETPGDWIAGRTVLTTTEWNSLTGNNAISFKVRVEANEGIWVEEEEYYVLANLNSNSNWKAIRANITSIEFSTNSTVPANAISSFEATDVTSRGTVTVYTVDDGSGTNTYKAIICADDEIYAPENSSRLFMNMSKLVTFNSQNFRVDNVTNMSSVFAKCGLLQDINSLASWNTFNVQFLSSSFNGCASLANINALINWNTSNVTDMIGMFANCTNLTNTNGLIRWNTSNVQSMLNIFYNCTNLQNINGLISWNTSNVTNMGQMFCRCTNLIDFSPLADWNTSNVTDMNFMFGMDANTSKTNNPIIDFSALSNWNVSKVEKMNSMFQNVNVASYLPFKNWNVGKVEDFNNMFNATSASTVTTLLGLENWNISSATNMDSMFYDNVSLTDASGINDWNINANISFTEMFCYTPVHPEFTQVQGTWDSDGTFTPNA